MKKHEDILNEFLADQHMEGKVVPKSYFWDLFGLKQPRGLIDTKAKERADLAFMSALGRLQDDLIGKHQIDLQNVRSKGYRLVPYQERVSEAVADMKRAARRVFGGASKRLRNIPELDNLPYPDKRMHDWGLQMAARMRSELRMAPRYPKD